MTFSTSLIFTFLSFIGTAPEEFKPLTLPPEIPTKAFVTCLPDISSAFETASLTAATVDSISTITPSRRPIEF